MILTIKNSEVLNTSKKAKEMSKNVTESSCITEHIMYRKGVVRCDQYLSHYSMLKIDWFLPLFPSKSRR